MKVLWLANGPISKVSNYLGRKGGISWIDGMFDSLRLYDKTNYITKIIACFPSHDVLKVEYGTVDEKLEYVMFPASKKSPDIYIKEQEQYFENIIKNKKPDIIHIFGTEYPHSLAMARVANKINAIEKVVVNIQGLTSICGQYHYFAGLEGKTIHSATIRDILKKDNIFQQSYRFRKRGFYEVETLKLVKNVIGRTDWDRACSYLNNDKLNYYFCNETLRDVFYTGQWSLSECEKYSLFFSQSYYPVKGFHCLLKILPYLLQKFPDLHIYTTGKNPLEANTFLKKQRQTYYDRYIAKLLIDNHLENKVTYLGKLTAIEMKNRYLKSNVFVSASSIENESNSISEAKILGVPVVASYVGGVTDRIIHKTDGYFYPFNEPYMLAYYIEKIFNDEQSTNIISKNARENALTLHDQRKNALALLEIYHSIIKRSSL